MGSAGTATGKRIPKSINWTGKTSAEYKVSYWSGRVKPTYQPIRMSNGKVFKVYTELS